MQIYQTPRTRNLPPLKVEVQISCHAYSVRINNSEVADLRDHNGNDRKFCRTRYELSKLLPQIIQNAVKNDHNSFQVKDSNKRKNLAIFNLSNGQEYCVIYLLDPVFTQTCHLIMKIVSAIPNKTRNRHEKSNKFSHYARKCFHSKKRQP